MPSRFSLLSFLLCCAVLPSASAEEGEARLKLERRFNALPEPAQETPVFIFADQIQGTHQEQVEATGQVELRKHGQSVEADRLHYDQVTQQVHAEGSVVLRQRGDTARGPVLDFNLDSNQGKLPQPEYFLSDNGSHGQADMLNLTSRETYNLDNASYTTCPIGQEDWVMTMRELAIDRSQQVGEATSSWVEFKGVPILYSPWMDFPLGGQRKTGFLAPVIGSTSKGGSEVMLPFYWNIAPNFDATLAPRAMFKRGVLFNNEVRYLEPTFGGRLNLDVLPGDQLLNQTRSRIAWQHNQNLGGGLNGAISYGRVSDNAYFRDLGNTLASAGGTPTTAASQVYLPQQATLSYAANGWSAMGLVQRFQTLQDPLAPVGVPYYRTPQISFYAQQPVADGNARFIGEVVNFTHPTSVNGQRLVLHPNLSYPLVNDPAYFITPKVGLHSTFYQLGMNNAAGLPQNASRVLPIMSVDSGLVFERDTELRDTGFIQTLEPRLYYAYIPYQNQNQLPVFDSAQADYSFAQLFTENRFIGNDRVGDANQVTMAVTSRLLEADTAIERLRVTLGQRVSIRAPQVNLITPANTSNNGDLLLSVSAKPDRRWTVLSDFQYNPTQSRNEKFNAAIRYQPEAGKALGLGYRFSRTLLNQVDLSGQWPVSARWSGVARWNYSFLDKSLVEALAGLEYNRECWTVRVVAQRYAIATQQTSTGFFVQLELNGLVRVGSDALALLRQRLPGYTQHTQPPADVSVPGGYY